MTRSENQSHSIHVAAAIAHLSDEVLAALLRRKGCDRRVVRLAELTRELVRLRHSAAKRRVATASRRKAR